MSGQTTYDQFPAARYEGQIADAGPRDVVSRIATVAIDAGKFVVHDGTSEDKAIKLPSAAAEITGNAAQGIATLDTSREPGGYVAEDVVPTLRKGRVAVKVEDAVTMGAPVFVRYAAGGDGPGSFRSDDPGTAAAQLPGAEFVSSASAAELAIVEFTLS